MQYFPTVQIMKVGHCWLTSLYTLLYVNSANKMRSKIKNISIFDLGAKIKMVFKAFWDKARV